MFNLGSRSLLYSVAKRKSVRQVWWNASAENLNLIVQVAPLGDGVLFCDNPLNDLVIITILKTKKVSFHRVFCYSLGHLYNLLI